jgi:NAD(P)-dependent dehydrogenase (short-subunit alcohol dehydrogenase family)
MRLKGQTAVITGGASEIGAACARRLLEEGATVAALDLLPKAIEGALSLACDVRSTDELLRAAERIKAELGETSILVNCAATTIFAETFATNAADFQRIMEINVWGVMNASQVFAPGMRRTRHGSIVNIASISGLLGAPGMSAYAASKGALITLTRTLALELAEDNVRVNCVCPASIDTPMLQAKFDRAPDPAQARESNVKRHPLGRLGTPQDVANLVLFLSSDEAAWITGGTYVIDGGASIARR